MSQIYKLICTVTAVMMFLGLLPAVQAAPAIMPVEEVKPGMRGIGKTVIQGTRIEDFDVEVLSILKNRGSSGDLIMVRTSGPVIERSGGIAAGMSGSPVYINGKLVGALAYGWSLTDHRIGLVTPIEDMLAMADLPEAPQGFKAPGIPASAGLRPLATPLMVSGMGERAMNKLADMLKPYNVTPVVAGGGTEIADTTELEPGSAMGIQLVRGDIDLTAIGTVTYRDGNRILGFGHPFLRRGGTGFLLTTAYIHQTVPSLENPFKIGTSMNLVGTVSQDRGTGVAGSLDRLPLVVPARIHVIDKDSGKNRDINVQVINDEKFTPFLVVAAAFQGVEQTLDRIGPGTARVSLEIMGRGLPNLTVKRDNMFFSREDIASSAVADLFEGLNIIMTNPFQPVDIVDVKVNVTVEQARQTATIEQAVAMQSNVRPGDTVDIMVTLKPYRGAAFNRVLKVTVPDNQPPGTATLVVRGGGSLSYLSKLLAQNPEANVEQIVSPATPQNLSELIDQYANRERNNDLVAEFMTWESSEGSYEYPDKAGIRQHPMATGEKYPGSQTVKPMKPGKKPGDGREKFIVTTDYIVEGDTMVFININHSKSKK